MIVVQGTFAVMLDDLQTRILLEVRNTPQRLGKCLGVLVDGLNFENVPIEHAANPFYQVSLVAVGQGWIVAAAMSRGSSKPTVSTTSVSPSHFPMACISWPLDWGPSDGRGHP